MSIRGFHCRNCTLKLVFFMPWLSLSFGSRVVRLWALVREGHGRYRQRGSLRWKDVELTEQLQQQMWPVVWCVDI